MEKLKKHFILMTLVFLALQSFISHVSFAATAGNVVINEIAWAGTSDDSNDEWIELYNNTSQAIDLSGWHIEDDVTTIYTINSGTIPAHGYFLIEDSEVSVSNISADAVIGISLANAGDSLVLKNPSGDVIDTVNGSGGAWYAGNATSKATMERIDPTVLTDNASNWATAKSGNGSTGRSGGSILGTPKGANSNFSGGMSVVLNTLNPNVSSGQTFNVSVSVNSAVDMYAYGFELNYNSSVLDYISATESNFLKADGTPTSFNAALENGNEGKLIVGNARLVNPPNGVNGSGELFTATFKAIGSSGASSAINFGSDSFISDTAGNVSASLNPLTITIEQSVVLGPVQNLQSALGAEMYSLKLTWSAPTSGADKYLIKRKLPNGNFVALGETTSLFFTDDDAIPSGGKIIPNVEYEYQVFAVKNGEYSSASLISAVETRGITGDNNRSGRVDGRDLEKLARSYGSSFGDGEYDPLADTNYDGVIDGSDLIDIGANFGVKI